AVRVERPSWGPSSCHRPRRIRRPAPGTAGTSTICSCRHSLVMREGEWTHCMRSSPRHVTFPAQAILKQKTACGSARWSKAASGEEAVSKPHPCPPPRNGEGEKEAGWANSLVGQIVNPAAQTQRSIVNPALCLQGRITNPAHAPPRSPSAPPSPKRRGGQGVGSLIRCSAEQLLDHLALAEQLDGPVRRRHQLRVRVDAQLLENRGRHVVR